MGGALQRSGGSDLDARLEALKEALEVASGRLPESDAAPTRDVLQRAGHRLGLGLDFTVAALAGATGSGKSSLFNRIAGTQLSSAGARRPTTGVAHACVWGEAEAGPLLDWLAIPRRHHQPSSTSDRSLDGLVLLDLPDSDSTEVAHRIEVDRLVELVDLLIWVLDPQKYADAVLHERYLRPLASHSSVMLLVLNQADRLDRNSRESCLADIKTLARGDDLGEVPVLATSATTGEGMDALMEELTRKVGARRAAVDRLTADVDRAVSRLSESCDPKREPKDIRGGQKDILVDALAEAGGVEVVATAVAESHIHRAMLATGSPFTRWLRRMRPDPLKRLHLSPGGETAARTSLPPPSPIQRAKVGTAIRRLSQAASQGLPQPWPEVILATATSQEERLPDELDRSVVHADVGGSQPPRWWKVVGGLQVLLALTAIAGAVWLAVLFFFDWLKFPALPLPHVNRLPVPTLLLLGGLLLGFVIAFVSKQIANVGGRRRKRVARNRLRARIGKLADEQVVEPLNSELAAYRSFCGALERAGGSRRRWRGRK